MREISQAFSLLAMLAALGAGAAAVQAAEGAIASDRGGANGYQHSIDRSRFLTGANAAQMRPVEEFGFAKVMGPRGVFATNLRNGLVIATQNNGMDKSDAAPEQDEPKAEHLLNPDKHNAMVMDYLLAAGVPRDQVAGVHATTYLAASGSGEEAATVHRKVQGYASILERTVGGKFAVPESVAWARFDGESRSITEWVYWPPIPAEAIEEARRLEELTAGRAVKARGAANMSNTPTGSVVIRHFDAAGVERRLPSEIFNLGQPDPASK